MQRHRMLSHKSEERESTWWRLRSPSPRRPRREPPFSAIPAMRRSLAVNFYWYKFTSGREDATATRMAFWYQRK
eukprot:1680716-Rhodomonas_salina.5